MRENDDRSVTQPATFISEYIRFPERIVSILPDSVSQPQILEWLHFKTEHLTAPYLQNPGTIPFIQTQRH